MGNEMTGHTDINPNCKKGSGCCESCGPVTINAEVSGSVEVKTHEGREHIVVPVVAIVEGVLNGSLVTEEEFGKYVHSWEGVPVPVSHPQVNGVHVSASIPSILESRNIGRFHNVTSSEGKLKGELWIDVEAANRKGFGEIVEAFQNSEVMEVSTAYYADTEQSGGTFKGVRYTGIHRNLRPDHLAVLPNEIGACSVEDGCGTFQNSEKGIFMSALEKIRGLFGMPAFGLEANEESIGDKMMAVRKAVDDMDGHGKVFYLVDVFEDYAVYESDGKMYQRNYTIDDNGSAEFTSEPVEVRIEKMFIPVSQEDSPSGEDMASNADLEPNNGDENNQEETTMSDNTDTQALDAESVTAVNWAKQQYSKRHGELVGALSANERCQFSKDELEAMSVDTLEKFAGSLAVDYSGRGFPVTHSSYDSGEQALAIEPVVMAKVEVK